MNGAIFFDPVTRSLVPASDDLVQEAEVEAVRSDPDGPLTLEVAEAGYRVNIYISADSCDVFVEAPPLRREGLAVRFVVGDEQSEVPADLAGFASLYWSEPPRSLAIAVLSGGITTLIGSFRFILPDDAVTVVLRSLNGTLEFCVPDARPDWTTFDGTADELVDALLSITSLDASPSVSRGRTVTSSDLLRSLLRLDAEVVHGRGKGSHILVTRPGLSRPVPIPMHSGDLGKGLYRRIVKDLGLLLADVERA